MSEQCGIASSCSSEGGEGNLIDGIHLKPSWKHFSYFRRVGEGGGAHILVYSLNW